MSKKKFGKGIDAIFTKSPDHVIDEHLKKEVKTSFVLDSQLLETIKAISYWDRKPIKQFIIEALNEKISSIDKKTLALAIESYKNSMGNCNEKK